MSSSSARSSGYRAIADPMPAELARAEGLSDYDEAIRRIHFPEDDRQLSAAIERLKFDELFTLELGVAFRKHRVEAERTGVAHAAGGPLAGDWTRRSRSTPTGAQIAGDGGGRRGHGPRRAR